MSARHVSAGCAVVAALLLIACVVLWFSNPSVDVTATDYGLDGSAGEVECNIAPWDAGRNGSRSEPGSEHLPAFRNEVTSDCYSAGVLRYNAALVTGTLAVLALGVALAAAVRSPRAAVRWLAVSLASTVVGGVAGYTLLQLLAGGRYDFPDQCAVQSDGSTACTLMGFYPRSYWVDVGAAGCGAFMALLAWAIYFLVRRKQSNGATQRGGT